MSEASANGTNQLKASESTSETVLVSAEVVMGMVVGGPASVEAEVAAETQKSGGPT